MKDKKERKVYETPQVVFEKELEALAGYCGDLTPDTYLGNNNCKADARCTVTLS